MGSRQTEGRKEAWDRSESSGVDGELGPDGEVREMLEFYVKCRNWLEGDEGATALEYGILVALIALVITAGVFAFGDTLNKFFDSITMGAGSVTSS